MHGLILLLLLMHQQDSSIDIGDLHPISPSPCRVYKNRLSRLRERGGFSAKAVVLRLNSALSRDAIDIMLKKGKSAIRIYREILGSKRMAGLSFLGEGLLCQHSRA